MVLLWTVDRGQKAFLQTCCTVFWPTFGKNDLITQIIRGSAHFLWHTIIHIHTGIIITIIMIIRLEIYRLLSGSIPCLRSLKLQAVCIPTALPFFLMRFMILATACHWDYHGTFKKSQSRNVMLRSLMATGGFL